MPSSSRKLVRFYSEQTHDNYGYIEEQTKAVLSTDIQPHLVSLEQTSSIKKNFLRQLSSQAEQKIDRSEQEAQHLGELLQKPIFTRVLSLQEDVNKSDVIIHSSVLPHTIIETGLAAHRQMKSGSQRFRWNLLFNLLVWLIVPLPFWIPFVSNQLAYYLLPSIQGVFVFMWIGKERFLPLI